MKLELEQLEDIKSTITWLLENGSFIDLETAYNSAMNSVNTLDEAINYIRCCKQLKDMEETKKQDESAQLGIGAFISRFLSDMAEKHNKDKESLCVQVSGDDIELYEVENDGYHNWLTHIETIENGL